MIKKNWKLLLITSIITLLPIVVGLLLWDKLPEQIPSHWNAQGVIDGYQSKTTAVFLMPLFMLAVQWICAIATAADPKSKNHSNKIVNLTLWIIPLLSIVIHSMIYLTAMGSSISTNHIGAIVIGVVFILFGNYMPKIKQNYTIGIKIPWTLQNEEVWNKTHRLAGRLWVMSGFVMILSVFLPTILIGLVILLVSTIIPIIYAYILYQKVGSTNAEE